MSTTEKLIQTVIINGGPALRLYDASQEGFIASQQSLNGPVRLKE